MNERRKVSVVQGDRVESLWAQAVGEGLYRIDNIPFEIYGLSMGDTVCASEKKDVLLFDGLFDRAGATTLRVRVPGGFAATAGQTVLGLLNQYGYEHESYGDTIVAVHIPPGQDPEDFRVRLGMLADAGVTFEQSDPDGVMELRDVPGSRAERKRREHNEDLLRQLEEFANTPLKKP